jgi:hypothetical protein
MRAIPGLLSFAFLAVLLKVALLPMFGIGAGAGSQGRPEPRQARPILDFTFPQPLAEAFRSPREEPDLDPIPGRGNALGTGTVDPQLLKAALPATQGPDVPAMALREDAPLTLPLQPIQVGFRKDLPVAPGGNGWPRGQGGDLGTGSGSAMGTGRDGRTVAGVGGELEDLQPTRRVRASLRTFDFKSTDFVIVKVLLGPDGVPRSATAIQGKAAYFQICEVTALLWRFHVPAHLARNPPISCNITFRLSEQGRG